MLGLMLLEQSTGLKLPTGYLAAALLASCNVAHAAGTAHVHEENPVTTPIPIAVVLPSVAGGGKLETDQVSVWNCVDEHSTSGPPHELPICVPRQRAIADGNGDFPYLPAEDTDASDLHAEVAAFFHATKTINFLAALGMPAFGKALDVIVNVQLPSGWQTGRTPSGAESLTPYGGAIYVRRDPFAGLYQQVGVWNGPGLWLGQGPRADSAYDGDVVAHELTHAAVDQVVALGTIWHRDRQGAMPMAATWNEALADFFAAALHGNPVVGEYAARNGVAARSLAAVRTCPSGLSGQSHSDSRIFSGALWSARARLASAEHAAFDRAVWASLTRLPGANVGPDDVMASLLGAFGESPLGDRGVKLLKEVLGDRGLWPSCLRILQWSGMPVSGPDPHLGNLFLAPGRNAVDLPVGAAFAPGMLQVRAVLPPYTEQVRISLRTPGASVSDTTFAPSLLISFAGPIDFPDAKTLLAPPWPHIEMVDLGGEWHAELQVPPGATNIHIMVVNRSENTGGYRDLSFNMRVSLPSADAGGAPTGVDAGLPEPPSVVAPSATSGCSMVPARPSTRPTGTGSLFIVVFAWLFRCRYILV